MGAKTAILAYADLDAREVLQGRPTLDRGAALELVGWVVTQLQRLLDGGAVKRTGPDGRPGRGRPRKRPAKLAGDKGYS